MFGETAGLGDGRQLREPAELLPRPRPRPRPPPSPAPAPAPVSPCSWLLPEAALQRSLALTARTARKRQARDPSVA